MAMPDFLDNEPPEVTQAKELAKRYRLPYIDLLPPDKDSPISYEELAGIPVELMFVISLFRCGAKAEICTSEWLIRRIWKFWTNSKMS